MLPSGSQKRRSERRRRSQKAGLPPGALVHIGEPPATPGQQAQIRIVDYDDASLEERTVEDVAACTTYRHRSSISWIDVASVHQVETVRQLGEAFGVHPLTLEDILNTHQRPKMEDYGDYIYVVLQMLTWKEATQEVAAEQLSLILGPGFVLSFGEQPGEDVLGVVRQRLHQQRGRVRRMGADYLAYALVDAVVDRYFIVVEKLADRIEQLEDEMLLGTEEAPQVIQHLRREALYLRHAVWPLRELIAGLRREDLTLVGDETRVYLKDIHDHTVQIMDMVEGIREATTNLLELHLAVLNRRLNETMKILTLFAAVFIPLTFIVGVYGMNFEHMPELHWPWAYPALWALMISLGVGLVAFFRHRRWI